MEAYLPAPELIWGLLPRLLGLMLLVAHGSLISQLVGGIGENGNFPVGPRLQRMRRDFGPVQRIMRMPTLFWLSSSDWMIRLVPCLGALGGLAAMYGGEIGWWGLLVGYICFLSVEQVALTVFPWDTMLLEVTFLGLFLPASLPLPELAAASVPLPTVAFMFRWLAIRLMWGFAKVKFVGTKPGDEIWVWGRWAWALGVSADNAPDDIGRNCIGDAVCLPPVQAGRLYSLLGVFPRTVCWCRKDSQTNKRTTKQTNKQTNKQPNNQTNNQ